MQDSIRCTNQVDANDDGRAVLAGFLTCVAIPAEHEWLSIAGRSVQKSIVLDVRFGSEAASWAIPL